LLKLIFFLVIRLPPLNLLSLFVGDADAAAASLQSSNQATQGATQQLAITTTSKIPQQPSEQEERIRFRLEQQHEQREPSSHPASQSNTKNKNNNRNKPWDVEQTTQHKTREHVVFP
jgi:hypothetical protein